MATDPTQLIQQLMQQQGGQAPPQGQPMPMQGQAPTPPTDEAMLDTVHNAMGERSAGGPPPGSGMKWQNLEEDQTALEQNPTPENIDAFVQYWGEENLPENLKTDNESTEPTPDNESTE